MKSFGLLHTNVALTTNIQIMVSKQGNLYMESIDSNDELSSDRFKRVEFKKDAKYDQLIPTFYEDLPAKYAFEVKYDEDNDEMFKDYSKQFDDTYQMGCNIVDNVNYEEEFSCFAPLHFEKDHYPQGLMIFRADGPGLIEIDKDNFREQILDKLKCVEYFNMTEETPLGEWISTSFRNERDFPEFKFNLDVRSDEFSEWSGIDYVSGGFTSKSLFMKDLLETENTFFDLEKTLTSGYQENKVVYPNIVNFNFLFNDTPATKKSLRKWSLNRYYGFYIESLDNIRRVTPYSPMELYNDIKIEDNILSSLSEPDPFVRGFKDSKTFVEYKGDFYQVRIDNLGRYKIISPIDLTGEENLLNKQVISINQSNEISFNSTFNSSSFDIKNFDDADVWVINIDGKFHRLIKNDNGNIEILSDYGFSINNNKLKYFINESDESFTTTVDLTRIDKDNPPMTFNIFRLKFSDIKDFDNELISTGFNRYEYEKEDVISSTLEPKSFKIKPTNSDVNVEFNEYIYGNELVNIPTTSEYVGNSELFEINNPDNPEVSDLSSVWRKNPIFTKWGYEGSINNGDYPYRLNNSFYGENFNKSTNVYQQLPNRVERNLDYFYTINPDNNDYIDYTLNISDVDMNGNIDPNFEFELDKYFNVGTVSCGTSSATYSNNYFDYLFSKKEVLDTGDIVRNTNKYSMILDGDDDIPNRTLFRGILFKMYEVDKVNTNTNQNGLKSIEDVSVVSSNRFDDWKFSIILSERKYDIDSETFVYSPTSSLVSNNSDWDIIDIWETSQTYDQSSLVLYQDIVYISSTSSTIESTLDNPGISSDWSFGTVSTPFWNPSTSYSADDWVYNGGEYYISTTFSSATDFYNPSATYSQGDYVIYKNDFYESLTASNVSIPKSGDWSKVDESIIPSFNWRIVNLWSSNETYSTNDFIYYKGTLYKALNTTLNNIPDQSSQWERIHSFFPEDRTYGTGKLDNNVIQMNNKYYLSLTTSNTLDNGINVYINKKWNNILVHIYIDDNTVDNLKNVKRDEMYDIINEKITAHNFIGYINDISERRGFINTLNYYVIEEDLSYEKYSLDNIEDIPFIMSAEDPENFDTLIGSLKRNPVRLSENVIKPQFKLKDNEINNIDQINYYNNEAIATSIQQVTDDEKDELTTKTTLYRFNGNYSPIFKDIELFKRPTLCCNIDGNYKFDEELTDFGIIQEKIISKVNLKDVIFKLKDKKSIRSIYPKLDEFGYYVTQHNIFKSTWDKKFYTLVEKK
jgi:hypothetical protein